MASITIAGLDPSLQNFGMVKGTLDLESGVLSNLQLLLNETKPDNKNKSVRKNSHDLERARSHFEALKQFLLDVDLVCVEIPVGSKSARSMTSYGICIGLLASIEIPMIQVTPTEVKVAATGSKTASKMDMVSWAFDQFPQAPWLVKTRNGVQELVAKNEHLADGLATIYAGVKTDEFKYLTLLKKDQQ